MPFEKGTSGNINGRPKGAINKTGMQLRETITAFLENNFERIVNDFDELTPKERVKLYCELLQFGLPKLQATSLDVDFEKFTDEQLDFFLEGLKKSCYEPQ